LLTKLSRHAYATVAPLLTGFDHQLSVAAVLGAAMPGEVFVDDPVHPSVVVVHSPEGTFVGGTPANADFVAEIREHLAGALVPEPVGDLVLSFDHEGWSALSPMLAPDLTCFAVPRRHYLYQAGQLPVPPKLTSLRPRGLPAPRQALAGVLRSAWPARGQQDRDRTNTSIMSFLLGNCGLGYQAAAVIARVRVWARP